MHWLRIRIIGDLTRRLARAWVVALVVAHVVLLLATDASGWLLVGWSALLAQLLVAVPVGLSMAGNPLSVGFLRRYLARPLDLVPHPVDGEPHPSGVGIERDLGMGWLGTVTDPAAEVAPVFDLYQAADGRSVAALSRTTGDLTAVSRLNDGRLLQTSALLVPPHRDLVVNTAPAPDPLAVWGTHLGALGALSAHGVVAVRTPPQAFGDAMAAEFAAYAQLGPWLASFYDPGRSSVAPFTVAVTAAEHFEVSVLS